jgi:hypothetical protein
MKHIGKNYSSYTLTTADLTEKNGDTYYIGPLEEAIDFIHQDRGTAILYDAGTDQYTVLIGYSAEAPTWENAAEWGRSKSLIEAWRFVLGASFGPADSEFVPIELVG